MSMSYAGWRCPQCGGVFSPFTPRCMNCYGTVPTVMTNTTVRPCSGCGKIPCDRSTTGCPPLFTHHTVTV